VNSEAGILVARVVGPFLLPLLILPIMIWLERKASAFMQDRTGPNRAAIAGIRLGGIIHTLADVAKLLGKEDIVPVTVNRGYHALAPFIAIFVAQLIFIVIPLADDLWIGGQVVPLQALRLDVGILYPLAVGSVFVYSIVIAGWASNNKFGVLGGLRAAAQVVSYEVALGLSIVGALMIYGTTDLSVMVQKQGELLWGFLPKWGILLQPVGAVLFLVAAFAETNRTPFDMPERDAEIVAGYHTEYSGLRFAFFFMAEYIHIIVASALVVTLFFGGWQVPWLGTAKLQEHAPLVLDIMLGGLVVGGLVAAVLAFRWSKTLHRQFTDARRHEGSILGAAAAGVAITALAVLAWVQSQTLPEWAPAALAALAQFSAFMAKMMFFAFGFIWIRWTLPSFRYDQLMRLGWKNLMPIALANIVLTGIVLLLVDAGRRG
jgi:NADH-quinone oxidoreductase subunit H